MKKLILSIALGGLTASGFAQGTVSFQNFSNAGGGIVSSNGTPMSGAVTLELFYGPVGSTLAQLTAGGAGFGDAIFATTISTSTPGKFFDGTTVISSQPAGGGTSDATLNIELAIAGWTGGAANYGAAIGAAPLIGITGAWGNPTGGGSGGTIAPAGLINWVVGNSLTLAPSPEPATLALGGLGAAALLMFRRRK
jgi:PEP-CTERM motif